MIKEHLIPITSEPQILDFTKKQLEVFWLPTEPKVEKDIQDILTKLTPQEKHAVITVLKLFSIYETHAGSEYWGTRYREITEDETSEFERMASVFSMFELAIHGPFYNKINELLNLNTKEFYTSYYDDPVLRSRIQKLQEYIDHPNPLVSLGVFSLIEGVILYSAFAFLKHFQSTGKNKILNIIRGINFSVRDENLHSIASAWTYVYKRNKIDNTETESYELIKEAALELLESEKQIIKLMFSEGEIEGITELQLERFVQSRINICFESLGFPKLFHVEYNPIAEWFYKGINNFQFNDFFTGQGREYNRDWSEGDFTWNTPTSELC
jgi:ribonucleotide reductase beta subunit family protein with ferritin-like domain